MKKGWVIKKLGEICEIERGGSPRPIDSFLTDSPDGINWIKIGDTKGITKYIYKTKEKIRPEGAKRSRVVKDGDFILSNSMSFGHPYIMKTTGCIHDGWLVLREKAPNINKDFLYHVLGSDLVYQQFDNLAAGSTVRNLNIDLVKSVQVPIPPLPEQERIVAILDETFTTIAKARENTENNLANARGVFESYLQQVFSDRDVGWEEKTLGEILSIERGGSPRPIEKYLTNSHDGINWIKISDATASDKYIYKTKEKITPEGLRKTRLVNEGDFILSNSMSFGRPYIMKTTGCIHDGWLVLKHNGTKVFETEFLYYLLSSSFVFKQFNILAAGSTVRNLNIALVSSVKVPIPTFPEQQSIVSKLDSLSVETKKLETIYKKKLTDLDELKKSILEKAFAGEL